MSRPPKYDVTAIAAVSAESTHPAATAESSRSISTALMKIGTSTIEITNDAPTMKFTTSATCTLRPRKTDRSTKGSNATRWCQMNRPPAATATR